MTTGTSAHPTCGEYAGLLAREADGRLDRGDARVALEAHLARCLGCREALATQQMIHDTLAAADIVPAPVGFDRRVMAAVRQEAPWTARWNWRAWTLRLAPVPAALIVAVVFVLRNQTASTVTNDTTTPSAATGTAQVSDALWSPAISDTSLLSLLLNANADDALTDHLKDK